jgi:hypothetical protein
MPQKCLAVAIEQGIPAPETRIPYARQVGRTGWEEYVGKMEKLGPVAAMGLLNEGI